MTTPEERALKFFSGCFCSALEFSNPRPRRRIPIKCNYCLLVEEFRAAEAGILEASAKIAGGHRCVSCTHEQVSLYDQFFAMARERRDGK